MYLPSADQPVRTSIIPNTRAASDMRSRVFMERDATVATGTALSANFAQQTRCPLTRTSEGSYIGGAAGCVALTVD